MDDAIEQRLVAAADAVREHQVTTQRRADLQARVATMTAERDALRTQDDDEQEDVERLEGMSLARVLTALRGSREDALLRERAEAEAARYRLADAQARLDAVRREHDRVSSRLDQLAVAPAAYAAALEEKERYLSASGDQRGGRLLDLADGRGRLGAEVRELREAGQAAVRAQQALVVVQEILGRASGWSTYDTFFGGGMVSSSIKHSRLDEAAQAAAFADQCLGVLRTELADVGGVGLTVPTLVVDGLTRFVDVWFDNIVTDLAIREQIKHAQQNVARSSQMVAELRRRLQQRDQQASARLATLDAERHAILTAP